MNRYRCHPHAAATKVNAVRTASKPTTRRVLRTVNSLLVRSVIRRRYWPRGWGSSESGERAHIVTEPSPSARTRRVTRVNDQPRGRPLGSRSVLFPTIQFAVFFPIVFILSWLLRPYPTRWKVLMVIASYIFYGWWAWNYTFLLGASTIANHLFAKAILPSREPVRKVLMFAAVAVNLGILGYFKYYGFFVTSVVDGLADLGVKVSPPLFQVILPIGISFFTFQALSYVIDTYQQARSSRCRCSTSRRTLSFFPHLVAGPIVRAVGVPAPAQGATRPPLHQRRVRHSPDRRGVVPEGGGVELPRRRDRRRGVRGTGEPQLARDPVRDLRVRVPDLRGLRRLHEHRHRHRAAARRALSAELQLAVRRSIASGLLAAMAHDAVALPARLPVHPAGRQPGVEGCRRTAT